jgi:hypothetical protein
MKNIVPFVVSLTSSTLLLLGGCRKEDSASPNQTCADEHVLEVYQDRKAVVVMTQLDTYCLVVDSTAIAGGSYLLDDVLVPVPKLPAQYQVVGLQVRFSGRKKSCYGLTTLPNLRNMFGYKLEIDAIKESK